MSLKQAQNPHRQKPRIKKLNLKAEPNIKDKVSELLAGRLNLQDHVNKYLEQIENNSHLNAFLAIFSDQARAQADTLLKKIKSGQTVGKLAGTIVAIKDNISYSASNTTCASHILEKYCPPYNATVISRLVDADAIFIGKTNMDEFAMGSSTENSFFGPSKNPVDTGRVPGGSSGGSAVAVSAGLAQVALGSDTGGSIRQPAAFTGIVGLKPTYGRVSRYGLVAFASSLDQIGPLTTNIADVALILEVISGHDARDATSAKREVDTFSSYLKRDISGMRIGISQEYFEEGLSVRIKENIYSVIDFLKDNGAIIEEVHLPHSRFGVSTYYIIATAEASSNLARYDGIKFGFRSENQEDLYQTYRHTRNEGFGEEVKRRIMLGTYVLSAGYYDAYYKKAQQMRRLIKNDFDQVFEKIDCLLTPTTPTTAFKFGEKTENPLEMYLSDVYTVNANLAGIPAISIPIGHDSDGLPIGLQLMSAPFEERKLIQIGDFIETNFSENG